MFSQPIIAFLSAARLLFKRPRALVLMLLVYAGLLSALYLFVSTREATIFQLILTMALVVIAPALFFLLQAMSVSYTNGAFSRHVISNGLKLVVVSVPVIALSLLGLYGLNKWDSQTTIGLTFRYLLIGVIAPLLAIQLWIAASGSGFRSLLKNLRQVAVRTFAPQSVFVYACGFLIFAVAPYLLIMKTIPAERAWLEVSLLVLRLSAGALLVLVGWVTTVGAMSILSRDQIRHG